MSGESVRAVDNAVHGFVNYEFAPGWYIYENGSVYNSELMISLMVPLIHPKTQLSYFKINSTMYYVHEVVAAYFIFDKPLSYLVRHIDTDKRNNAASNLQIIYSRRVNTVEDLFEYALRDDFDNYASITSNASSAVKVAADTSSASNAGNANITSSAVKVAADTGSAVKVASRVNTPNDVIIPDREKIIGMFFGDNFENYSITNKGVIRCRLTGKIVAPYKTLRDNNSNWKVNLLPKRKTPQKKCALVSVARLVAFKFIGAFNKADHVLYIDYNKDNYHAKNLLIRKRGD